MSAATATKMPMQPSSEVVLDLPATKGMPRALHIAWGAKNYIDVLMLSREGYPYGTILATAVCHESADVYINAQRKLLWAKQTSFVVSDPEIERLLETFGPLGLTVKE